MRAAGCVKGVVAHVVDAVVVVDAPVSAENEAQTTAWEPAFLLPHAAASTVTVRPPPRLSATPPDLVVTFCRFTC